MIVLNLLKQHWINSFKALEDVVELVMIGGHHPVISQCCSSVNDIVVLLQIEEIIFLQVVITFFLDFVLDDEGHVAVREADVIFQIDPTVMCVVKSITLMIAKLLSFFGICSVLVDLADIIALQLDALLGDVDFLLLCNVRMAI